MAGPAQDPSEPMVAAKPAAQAAGVDTGVMGASIRQRLFGAGPERRPVKIGRFVVTRVVGEGGMGAVYRAIDPDLERAVAIKLVREGQRSPVARARALREAQALAKLSHPNVVTVHEVGVVELGDGGERIFVAMEFVEGSDLAAWTRENPPGPPRRLSVALRLLLDAGQGLVAAHDAGLVHRDFKPSNVLVGRDGRVRVADFGLARPAGAPRTPGDGTEDDSSGPDSASLTGTGTAVGTPAYMAPEQRRGREVDARTDQFAYCVAAWEVLFGARPDRTERPEPGPSARVPPWIAPILARGMATDPEDRHPTMRDLLRALRSDPTRRRRRVVVGVAATGSLVAAGLAYAGHREALCDDAAVELRTVWNDEARAAAARGLHDVGLPGAAKVWSVVERSLDAYAGEWSATALEVCARARQRGDLSEADHQLAVGCLDDRLQRMGAFVDVMEDANEHVVASAAGIAQHMLPTADCLDPAVVRRQAPQPSEPELSRRVAAVRTGLTKAWAVRKSGRYEDARSAYDALVAEAEELGFAPVLAQALASRGWALHRLSEYDAAEADLKQAYWLAFEHEDETVAAAAARSLVDHYANLRRYDDAVHWARYAEALGTRGLVSPVQRAQLLATKGRIASQQGDHAQAETLTLRAVALSETQWGPGHVASAPFLNNLGVVYSRQRRYAEAVETIERAVALSEAAYGDRWFTTAGQMANIGNYLGKLGRHREALAALTRALDITVAHFGPNHPDTVNTYGNLAVLAFRRGELNRALTLFRRARETLAATVSASDLRLAGLDFNIGGVLAGLGNCAEALPLQRAVYELRVKEWGAEAPATLFAAGYIAKCRFELGERDGGLTEFRRVVAVWRQSQPDHPYALDAEAMLAEAELTSGDVAASAAHLEHLERTARRVVPGSRELARILFLAADVRATQGGRERSLELSSEGLEIGETLYAEQPALVNPLLGHAAVLRKAGHHAQAHAYGAWALAIAVGPHGNPHWETKARAAMIGE